MPLTTADMGLKPFALFEAQISPLLRVPLTDKQIILEGLYDLARQRIEMDFTGSDYKAMVKEYRERHKIVSQTRAHILNARRAVEAANAKFLKTHRLLNATKILRQLDDLEKELYAQEQFHGALILEELKTAAEKGLPLPQHVIQADFGPHHTFPAGLKSTSKDRWFAAMIYQALPEPMPGKKSRFSRVGVVKKIFEFVGLPSTEKTIARRLKKGMPTAATSRLRKNCVERAISALVVTLARLLGGDWVCWRRPGCAFQGHVQTLRRRLTPREQ